MVGKHYKKSHAALSFYFQFYEKAKKPCEVAEDINVPYSTFMRWVSGENACPPEQLAAIYSVTQYQPFLQVLAPKGHRVIPIDRVCPDKGTVEEEIMDDIMASTAAVTLWRQALSDGKVSSQEKTEVIAALETQLNEVEETIAMVRAYENNG